MNILRLMNIAGDVIYVNMDNVIAITPVHNDPYGCSTELLTTCGQTIYVKNRIETIIQLL